MDKLKEMQDNKIQTAFKGTSQGMNTSGVFGLLQKINSKVYDSYMFYLSR